VRLPPVFLVAISAMLTLSALALWGLAYVYVLGSAQEHRAQHVLYASLRAQIAEGTAPTGARIPRGAPVAVLAIPKLGLRNVTVVEGTTSTDLEAGPGHRRDTPMPGQVGASFILGRSATFGAPFAGIAKLKPGDAVNVQTGEGKFSFKVDAVRRPGDSLTPFDEGAARLTLVTSEATKSGARQVVYVDATTNSNVQPAIAGRPSAIPVAERQLHGDGRGLGQGVLWLLSLVAAAVALSWTRARWGLQPTLVVGVPVLAALAWGVTESLIRLLPNLY
jgi:sortase A